MTEAEKLRDELAWFRTNKELVKALVNGTWQAVPRDPTKAMEIAGQPYIATRGTFKAMLAAAPKKPEE